MRQFETDVATLEGEPWHLYNVTFGVNFSNILLAKEHFQTIEDLFYLTLEEYYNEC